MEMERLQCCGWYEIGDMDEWDGDFDEAICKLVNFYDLPDTAGAVLFTSAGRLGAQKNARKFAAAIVKHKLGTVTVVPAFINPNTSNRIITYAWVMNQRAVSRYTKKLEKKEPERSGHWWDRKR